MITLPGFISSLNGSSQPFLISSIALSGNVISSVTDPTFFSNMELGPCIPSGVILGPVSPIAFQSPDDAPKGLTSGSINSMSLEPTTPAPCMVVLAPRLKRSLYLFPEDSSIARTVCAIVPKGNEVFLFLKASLYLFDINIFL